MAALRDRLPANFIVVPLVNAFLQCCMIPYVDVNICFPQRGHLSTLGMSVLCEPVVIRVIYIFGTFGVMHLETGNKMNVACVQESMSQAMLVCGHVGPNMCFRIKPRHVFDITSPSMAIGRIRV